MNRVQKGRYKKVLKNWVEDLNRRQLAIQSFRDTDTVGIQDYLVNVRVRVKQEIENLTKEGIR